MEAMITYEFWCKSGTGYRFVLVLPERREDPRRITYQSVVNLGRIVMGQNVNFVKILVVKATPDDGTEEQFNFKPPEPQSLRRAAFDAKGHESLTY